jgi:hypothetical protein
MRTRVPLGGYCPSQGLCFAIAIGNRYLVSKEIPFQWDADIGKALLWERRREAEDFLASRLGFSRHRYSVVQIREEA